MHKSCHFEVEHPFYHAVSRQFGNSIGDSRNMTITDENLKTTRFKNMCLCLTNLSDGRVICSGATAAPLIRAVPSFFPSLACSG